MYNSNDIQNIKKLLSERAAPLAEIYLRKMFNEIELYDSEYFTELCDIYQISNNFKLKEVELLNNANAKFALIKAWGYGFFSDVHHVAGSLLLSELLGRDPVIYWGNDSLFKKNGNDFENAFNLFYEPIGIKESINFENIFPKKWNSENIHKDNINKFKGTDSKMSFQYFFERKEKIIVLDFFTPIASLIPWIHQSSKFFNKSDDFLYSYVFQKYLKPTQEIQYAAENYFQKYMAGHNWIGVHVRGSDKILESSTLNETNNHYYYYIDKILELNDNINIFLMTDSDNILENYNKIYPDKIYYYNSIRTSNNSGVHYQDHDGSVLGKQVLIESLIALKCNYFVGNKESNVSLAISSMKDWPPGFIVMLGNGNVRGLNPFIYSI